MLFLHFFLLFLFGTFAVAAPTSPSPPQSPIRFESPEPEDRPQTAVKWSIPANGLGFWRRHPDNKNIPPSGRANDVIDVVNRKKIVLWRWNIWKHRAEKQFDLAADGQLDIATGRWIRPDNYREGSSEHGPVAENTFEEGTFKMVISPH